MKVFYDLATLPTFQNAVLTIGSYDGVHTGHQAIIRRINNLAKAIHGESVVITFHPHPRLFLYPNDDRLKLITTIEEKIHLLQSYAVNNLVIVPFNREFANQTPEAYIKNFLYQRFAPKRIVIGYDHRFGKKRAGNIDLLKQYEAIYDFKVEEINKQAVANIAVSSTKIRKALLNGEVRKASRFLNHPFVLKGKVIYGQQLGTTIGYPTANIEVKERHKLIPKQGIYAVRVVHQAQHYGGMLYIGNRPTLNGVTQSIEVNIFDFNQNIYGQSLTIEFIQWIRGDQTFENLEQLKTQLAQDKQDALKILNTSRS